jgi:flagellar basal-body rod protein FlgG
MDILSIATTGMMAQEVAVDVIANNLANLNTTGYMRRKTEFNDLLVDTWDRPDAPGSVANDLVLGAVETGFGVGLAAVTRIHEQGHLRATGNSFDVAIQGDGFFEIQLPDGTAAYTRDGTFQLNSAGDIVTHDGHLLAPGITVPSNAIDVTINLSGEVLAKIEGQVALQNLGQIQLTTFINAAGLDAVGNNLLVETPASGLPTVGTPTAAGVGSILQGYLEASNVNPIREITNMIKAQRAYEMNAKVVQAADAMLAPVQ